MIIFADHAATNVEGGMYISSEFQLGQVYIGEGEEPDDEVILYRPVYVCVPHEKITVTNIDKDGHMSRAGSRISMTRLNDRKFQLDSRASNASQSVEAKHEDSVADSPAFERSMALLSPDSASVDRGSDIDINKTPIGEKESDICMLVTDNDTPIPEVITSAPEIKKTDDVSLHVEDVENSVPESNAFTNCNGNPVTVDICNPDKNSVLKESDQSVTQVIEDENEKDNIDGPNYKKAYANDEPASIKCDHTPEVILVQSDSDKHENPLEKA